MKNNIFEVNNEERSRIIGLHESATKRQYLSEQGAVPTSTTEPIDNQSKQYAGIPDYATFFIDVNEKNGRGVDDIIKKMPFLKEFKFKKLKNTKSHKEAVKYLKTHLPKCIDIIGDYLLEH